MKTGLDKRDMQYIFSQLDYNQILEETLVSYD